MIWIPVGMADAEDRKKGKSKRDGKFPKSRPQRSEEGMYMRRSVGQCMDHDTDSAVLVYIQCMQP